MPAQRIRPCLACGALFAFDAEACPECQTAAAIPPAEEERVVPCLGCGALTTFGAESCASCGATIHPEAEPEQVRPCAACGELVAFDDLTCLECGALSLPLRVPEIAERPVPEGSGWRRVPDLLALGALGLGLVCLVGGALWIRLG